MSIGPVQMLILGFEDPNFTGENLAELERLREAEIIRLIDLLAIWKDEDGSVAVIQDTQLSEGERQEFGAVIGGLIGLGMAGEEGLEAGAEAGAEMMAEDEHLLDDENVWYAADVIPNNTAAVIALIEHRWAIPLRDGIARAGGFVLADQWIHAKDLVSVGLMAAEEAAAAEPAEA